MQVQHGINHVTGRPLLPPVKFREVQLPRKKKRAVGAQERDVMIQGMCHSCHKWIDLQSVKDVEVKVSAGECARW